MGHSMNGMMSKKTFVIAAVLLALCSSPPHPARRLPR